MPALPHLNNIGVTMNQPRLLLLCVLSMLLIANPSFANVPPVAVLTVSPSFGSSPLEVIFDASGSYDPDGMMLQFEWDLDGDGVYTLNSGTFPYVYAYFDIDGNATINASVRITDAFGSTATAFTILSIGEEEDRYAVVTTDAPNGEEYSGTLADNTQDNQSSTTTVINRDQNDDFDAYANDSMSDGDWLHSCYAPIPNRSKGARVYQSVDIAKMADEVLRLCNIERASAGLKPLKWGFHLELLAQAHARDMALRGYFDHTNLYGMSPGDRFDVVQPPKWSAYAENIAAGNQTAAEVVDSWMNSTGHRANILNPDVDYLGVGCYYLVNDPQYFGFYWVQFFATFFKDPSGHDWLDPNEIS